MINELEYATSSWKGLYLTSLTYVFAACGWATCPRVRGCKWSEKMEEGLTLTQSIAYLKNKWSSQMEKGESYSLFYFILFSSFSYSLQVNQ